MLNFVIVQGNIATEPVLGTTKQGKKVVNIKIACKRDVRSKKKKGKVYFLQLSFWGEQAQELVANYKKGEFISVVGYIEQVSHTTKDNTYFNTQNISVSQILSNDTKEIRKKLNNFQKELTATTEEIV